MDIIDMDAEVDLEKIRAGKDTDAADAAVFSYAEFDGASSDKQDEPEYKKRAIERENDIANIRTGSAEKGYEDRDKVQVTKHLLDDNEAPRKFKESKLYNFFHLGRRTKGYKILGAHFNEYTSTKLLGRKVRKLYTTETMNVMPGVTVDATNTAVNQTESNGEKIFAPEKVFKAKLNLYTGISRELYQYWSNFVVTDTNGNQDIQIKALPNGLAPLEENLTGSSIKRRLNFDEIIYDSKKKNALEFKGVKISYAGAKDIPEDKTTDLDETQFTPEVGFKLTTKILKNEDYLVAEENKNKKKEVVAAPEEEKKKKKEEPTEIEKLLAAKNKKKDKKTTINLVKEKADVAKYMWGTGKDAEGNDASMATDSGGFFNYAFKEKFLSKNYLELDPQTTSNGTKATWDYMDKTIAEKLEKGEKLTVYETNYARDIMTTNGPGGMLAKKVAAIWLGEDKVNLITELIKKDDYNLSAKDVILCHYVDEKYQTLFKEIVEGGKTPALSYLKAYIRGITQKNGYEYITNAKGVDEKGKHVWSKDIPNFSTPKGSIATKAAQKNVKAHKGVTARALLAPGLFWFGSFMPYINMIYDGNLDFYKDPSSKDLGKAEGEFLQKALEAPEEDGKPVPSPATLDQLFEQTHQNIKYHVKPYAEVGVAAGFDAKIGLEAGLGMILSAQADAAAKVGGEAKAKVGFDSVWTINGGALNMNNIAMDGLGLSLDFILNASADLKAEAKIVSTLFNWDYNLLTIQLLKLALKDFDIHGDIPIVKSGVGGINDFGFNITNSVTADVLGNKLVDNNYKNLSLEKKDAPNGLGLVLKEANDENQSLENFKTKTQIILLKVKDMIKDPNLVYKNGKDGAFGDMKLIFKGYASKLSKAIEGGKSTVDALVDMIKGIDDNKSLQKKITKLEGKVQKHQDKKDKVEAHHNARHGKPVNGAGIELKKNTNEEIKADNAEALEHYHSLSGYGQGKTDFDKHMTKKLKDEKINELMNAKTKDKDGKEKTTGFKDQVNAYIREKAKNTVRIIEAINKYKQDAEQAKKFGAHGTAMIPFPEAYQKIIDDPENKDTFGNIYNHLGYAHTGKGAKEKYKQFIKSKRAKVTEENDKNIAAIEKYIKDNKINAGVPTKKFSDWYFGQGMGKELTKYAVDVMPYKLMTSFFKQKLRDKKYGDGMDRIDSLENFRKAYASAQTDEDKKKIHDAAADLFFGVKGRESEFKKYYYRTGTNKDIIEYESKENIIGHYSDDMKKRAEYLDTINDIRKNANLVGIAGLDNANINKVSNELKLKDIGGVWKSRTFLNRIAGNYIKNAKNFISIGGEKSSIGKQRDLIKDNVTIQTIIDYEKKRIAKFTDSNDKDEADRHTKILNMIMVRVRQIRRVKEEDPEKTKDNQKKLINELRKDYFAGNIDRDAGVKASDHSILLDEVRKGELQDIDVYKKFLEVDQDSFRFKNGARKNAFETMLKNNKNMDDLEGYFRYNELRNYSKVTRLYKDATGYKTLGSYGFEKSMSKKLDKKLAEARKNKPGATVADVTEIDEMIRYEKRMMARATRDEKLGYIGTTFVDKNTDKIPLVGLATDKLSLDKQKYEDANILYEGGLYEVYEKMRRFDETYDGDLKDKQDAFAKMVKDNLLTGYFTTAGVFSEIFNTMSPNLALQMEKGMGDFKARDLDEEAAFADRLSDDISMYDSDRMMLRDQGQHKLYNAFHHNTFYRTEYDDYLSHEFKMAKEKNDMKAMSEILTPDTAIRYHNRRLKELTGKAAQIKFIVDNTPEEQQLQAFKDAGGAEIIYEANKKEIDKYAEDNFALRATSEEMALYEQERIDHYNKLISDLNKPKSDLQEVRGKLDNNLNWASNAIIVFENLTPERFFNNEKESFDLITKMDKGKEEVDKLLDKCDAKDITAAIEELKKLDPT